MEPKALLCRLTSLEDSEPTVHECAVHGQQLAAGCTVNAYALRKNLAYRGVDLEPLNYPVDPSSGRLLSSVPLRSNAITLHLGEPPIQRACALPAHGAKVLLSLFGLSLGLEGKYM